MTLQQFAVYDVKVGKYTQPFLLHSKGEAIRSWVDVVNDEKTNFKKHPEDYTLFHLGEWDDESGMTTNLTVPVPIGTALEYQNKN